MNSSRSRTVLRLGVLGVGLLLAVPAAQARETATGTVVAWGCGSSDVGQCRVPSGLTDVTAIAAGPFHALAVKRDGTVVVWGCGKGADVGQCSVPSGLSDVTAVAAGTYHSLALKRDGTVVAWGCGSVDAGQCSVPNGLTDVTAIAAGYWDSLAVKRDGTIVTWGCGTALVSTDYGQCRVPRSLPLPATAVAAGPFQSLALLTDSTVAAWGCNTLSVDAAGQCSVPGDLYGVTGIAAAFWHSLAVKRDGTVVAWGCGHADYGQCGVPSGLAEVTDVAAGDYHSLALKRDGTVVAWGCGHADYGQCSVPSALAGVSAIAAASSYSLALIGPRNQTITFGELADKTYGDPDFTLRATASSGLPVSFSAHGKCTVSAGRAHLTGAGSCTITASQAGNTDYRAAPTVSRTFEIAPAQCTVPNVIGKPVASAKLTIAKRHCRTGKVSYAYSRTKANNLVISQSRLPGTKLPPGSKIDLVVSRGRRA